MSDTGQIDRYNGGTIVAMKGAKCVAIACDLRLGDRMLTISAEKPKVYKFSDHLYMGIAGLATDAQTVVEKMTFRKNLYELRENRTIKPQVFMKMLSNLLYEKRFGPYFSEPLIAGLDPVTFEPFIAAMDLLGCISTPNDFVAVGTADSQLMGICEMLWEPNMGPDALFEATAQSLLSAMERDAKSGCGAVVYTITAKEVTVRTLKSRLD